MKISEVVKTNKVKSGYVWIDTCSLDNPYNPLVNMMDSMGLRNSDAIGNPFETMVFECTKKGEVISWKHLDKNNYKTEEEAKIGHEEMVKKWKNKLKHKNKNMNKKIVDKKFICPYCQADLKEVGIKNVQMGYMYYNCDIINDKGEIGNWEEYDFDANDYGEFYCGDCNQEIDLEELGLTI